MKSLFLAILLLIMPIAAVANEKVDVELAILVDTSSSISDNLLELQRSVLTNIVKSTAFKNRIDSNYNQKIAITYYEFSGKNEVVLPTTIVNSTDIFKFVENFPTERKAQGDTNSIDAVIEAYHDIMNNNIDSNSQSILLLTDEITLNRSQNYKNLYNVKIVAPKSLSLSAIKLPGTKYANDITSEWLKEDVIFGSKAELVEIEKINDVIQLILSLITIETS